MLPKLLLLSIVFSPLVLPLRAALDPSPRRGLGRLLMWLIGFNVCYVVAILYVLPRIS